MFIFNNRFYLQKEGLAIGSTLKASNGWKESTIYCLMSNCAQSTMLLRPVQIIHSLNNEYSMCIYIGICKKVKIY